MQIIKRNRKGDKTMFKITALFKKIVLTALVFALSLAALPFGGASAAGSDDPVSPPANQPLGSLRLEQIWARQQAIYQREGNRLDNASTLITNVQALIDKAKGKGWDTPSVQAALNAFAAVIPAAQAAHAPGAAIIASHAGFDAAGKVTDRAAALQTTKSLAKVLKDTRTAMNSTGKALRQAIRALRDAHPRSNTTPVP
jgi:hypothetical protein